MGAWLTVLFILTIRPTGALDSSTTGQGLVHTDGTITGTGKQYIRTCTRGLNRLGGNLLAPIAPSLNYSITSGLYKAGTGTLSALSAILLVLAPGSKNGYWLVMTSAGFTTGSTRTAKDLANSIAYSLANRSAHLSSKF